MSVANVVNVVNINSTCSVWDFNIYSWLWWFRVEKLFFLCLYLYSFHSYLISDTTCLVFWSPNFNGILKCVLHWMTKLDIAHGCRFVSLFAVTHDPTEKKNCHKSQRFISNSIQFPVQAATRVRWNSTVFNWDLA